MISSRLADMEAGLERHQGPIPYWNDFHLDRMGNVWLSRYAPPGQVPEKWRVLARDGAYLGWVSLPGVISILDITDNRILAVRLNEFDVPAVTMFELTTPQRRGVCPIEWPPWLTSLAPGSTERRAGNLWTSAAMGVGPMVIRRSPRRRCSVDCSGLRT